MTILYRKEKHRVRGNTRLVTTKSEIARIGSLCTAAPSLKKQKQKKKKKSGKGEGPQ